jgi:DNA repair exonuclease SbcCD ATPase subunit
MSFTLTLKNFKCFTNYSVNILSQSIILFDGPSGIGKSSLIQAFVFAVTGDGKKLYKQGTKTLCVELEYTYENGEKQFKIIRKKGPESLQYIEYKEKQEKQREFDDDEAQVRINNFFGKNFIETSVIKQKGENCFLSSSAKDKMVFLQSLLFSNSNIEKQRERVREILKQCKEDMNSLSIKAKTLEEILKNKKIDDKGYVNKYKDFSIEQCNDKIVSLEKNIADYQECIKKISDSIQTNQREKSKYNDEEIKYKQIKSRLLIFQDQLEEVNSKINVVNTTFNHESYESLIDNITNKKNKIKYLKLKAKCESTQQVLLNQIEKSLIEVEKENEVLNSKNKYNFDDNKYDRYCEKRDMLKKKKDNLKKLEECSYEEDDLINKRQEISDIKSYLDKAQLYKSSLSCPHCKNKVRLLNSVLEKIETESVDFSEKKIKDKKECLKVLEQDCEKLENNKKLFVHYTKELDKIQSKLDNIDDIPQEKISELSDIINRIDEIKTINKTLKKKKSDLIEEKRKVVDFTHDQLKQDYQSLQKLEKLQKEEKLEKDIEDLEKELAKLQFVLTEQERMKDELEVLLDKKRGITKDIKSIGSSVDECELNLNKLSKLIESCVQHILQQEEQLVSLKDNNKCDKWHNKIEKLRFQKIYMEQINETKRLEKEVQDINEHYKIVEKSCVNYSIIAEGIDHAESMLLSRFIDTINHNLSIHLDAFFEEPMHVQIKSFKEGKEKEKPVINLEIFYKGNETDLSNLSGGEYDRLNLALTLTFNCISNSPVLILDESLASINQELSTDIIMHMKEAISSKLIWMTQHQAVKGMFDKVYSV